MGGNGHSVRFLCLRGLVAHAPWKELGDVGSFFWEVSLLRVFVVAADVFSGAVVTLKTCRFHLSDM